MKALVSGASGFTGLHLVRHLNAIGVKVYSIGRSSVPNTLHYSLNDFSDQNKIKSIVREIKPNYLFHLVGTTLNNDIQTAFTINTLFGAILLEALETEGLAGKTRILFVGSAAEYGLVGEMAMPVKESLCPSPYNVYGISKLAQTQVALSWMKVNRKIVVARPFTIIGPGMPTHLAVGSFVEQIKSIIKGNGRNPLLTGSIDVSRDFLNVQDVVEMYWELVNTDASFGKVVNICSGQPLKLRTIVEYLLKNYGKNIGLEYNHARGHKVDMLVHYGDTTRLFDLIGSRKIVSWQRSLDQMMEFL